MNALSADLRAFVQQGVLTVPQAAGMMDSTQQPPPPAATSSAAAAADGHEETKEGEEDRGQPPELPPPAPQPINFRLPGHGNCKGNGSSRELLEFLGEIGAISD